MMAPDDGTSSSRVPRIIHAALIAGLILFGLVVHFVLLPKRRGTGALVEQVPLLVGLSIVGCAMAVVLAQFVPRPSDDESDDAFWRRASPRALNAWSIAEGVGLLAITVYYLNGAWVMIPVAVVAIIVLGFLNPAYFEGR